MKAQRRRSQRSIVRSGRFLLETRMGDEMRSAPSHLSLGQKTFFFPSSTCRLSSQAVDSAQTFGVHCASQAGVVSAECWWNSNMEDFTTRQCQCREVVTGTESVQSSAVHQSCVMSVAQDESMARFSCMF